MPLPAVAVADIDAGELVQIVLVPVIEAVGASHTFCVSVAVAGIGVAQLRLEYISTDITSPSFGVTVYVAVVTVGIAFLYH